MDRVSLQIEPLDRLCLIGRNGEGKSSLIKILAGMIQPDGGDIAIARGIQIAHVGQEVPERTRGRVWEQVAGNDPDRELSARQYCDRLGLDPEAETSELSGGNLRKIVIARALSGNPDLLLLDEPTNHLDIDTIIWMENELLRPGKTVVFVTHDRAFARKLATRCVEVDRGRLIDFSCGYDEFISKRDSLWEAEDEAFRKFEKKLSEEETWLRRGVKARRTRNEGRVKALKQLRKERSERRERVGSAQFQIEEGQRSGDLVLRCHNISFRYNEMSPWIVKDLDFDLRRGDRVGIIGPNGVGKSTLLSLILGGLEPTAGTVDLGTGVNILFMDQLRSRLDPEKSVEETVGEGYETIDIGGRKRHLLAYLKDFLFLPERVRSPVGQLSGGERNRLLLALLMKQPSNLLVLDEPTNDLDLETLELLEELIMQYSGTLLLVSHDRSFLDGVVTSTLRLDRDGRAFETIGGWDEALRVMTRQEGREDKEKEKRKGVDSRSENKQGNPSLKLSFKEKKELEELPAKLEDIEDRIEAIHNILSDNDLYKSTPERVPVLLRELEDLEKARNELYLRWEDLETRK